MKQRCQRVVTALIASVLMVGLPVASSARDDDASKAAATKAAATKAADTKAEWLKKYQDLKDKKAKLQHDYDQAVADYSRGRTTRHLAGGGKAGLVDEIDRLKDELAKVDQELADFPDEARKAGALPGWFRDDDTASASGNASPADTRARGLSSTGSRSLPSGASRSLGQATNDDETAPAAPARDENEDQGSGDNERSSSHGLPGLGSHQPSHHGLSH